MSPKILAAAVFLTAYALLITRKGRPPVVVWAGAAVLLALRVVTPAEALRSINVNVLGIIIGTMVLSNLFIDSSVPAYLACVTVNKSRSIGGALLAVCILAGAVSAFVDNVATVLMIAPIALAMSERLKVSPVSFLIGIAVSANLEGAATLVGDSTSVLLASAAEMTFLDFFWMNGRPGIFFSVQLGAAGAFYVLYRVFRYHQGQCPPVDQPAVRSWVPATLLVLMMATMALSSVIPNRPDWTIGAISLMYGAIGLIWSVLSKFGRMEMSDLDWSAVFQLSGLFILIGSLTTTGLVDDIASLISTSTKGNAFLAYTVIVWTSVLLSAFVDNIPYTMAMLPVAKMVANSTSTSPLAMMFGLLLGTTLGGNITPIGASANIVAVSLLRKNGHEVSFKDFVRVGLPFTVVAVMIGSLFNWMVWK